MACFLVPAAEAVITTIAAKAMKTQEASSNELVEGAEKIKFSKKLGWLNKLLWGGSALLAFEHVWHGEIIPVLPFLTAIKNGDTAAMLSEMSGVGTTMAVLITAVWGGMLVATSVIEKRVAKETEVKRAGI